ncbi:hypothetical protein A6R68_10082 [Neotoma lepida]|uniref:Uncharacterized protein n=1 Tax=Neotoma lepida TaxID=56216 RepID=A0A1A6FYT1_NEOLE|nr:hypothetical protein A6R68_10082 [Neotoma lepida]
MGYCEDHALHMNTPDSLRGSTLVLGSSREASFGKLQSQPSTSTCSPSPVTVRTEELKSQLNPNMKVPVTEGDVSMKT